MELANIENILKKYLEGETSLQEEAMLKNYFQTNNVPSHLQVYQQLFGYFKTAKETTFVRPIQLKRKRKNWKWASMVASVAIMCSMYFGNSYYQERQLQQQYAHVKEALQLVSVNLNKGDEAFASLHTYRNTVDAILKPSK